MALSRNTAEGQSSGTTLSAANSGGGSGNAFNQVVTAGTGAVIYSNEQAMFGTQSYKITSGSSSAVYIMYDPSTNMSGSAQMGIYVTGYPDVNQNILMFRTSGGAATVATISITSTGALRITNQAGSSLTTSSAGVVALNTWIRLDMHVRVGSTTSNGRVMVTASASNSPTASYSYDSGFAVNTGTSAIGNIRFGKNDTTPVMATYYVDDISIDPGAMTFIPPRPIGATAWFTA